MVLLPCYNTWGDINHPWYCCGITSEALACCNNGSSFPIPVAKLILWTFSSQTAVGITVNPTTTNPTTTTTPPPLCTIPTPPASPAKPTTGFNSLALSLGVG